MRLFLLTWIVIAGCASNQAGPDAGANGPDANNGAVVSFQNDVTPLFAGCAGFECHGAPAGPSSPWPYNFLVNQPAPECADGRDYVKPGDPANSYLLQKLKGVQLCSGHAMPLLGSSLTATQLQTISTWISQGALNN